MSNYRRSQQKGGSFFFTVALANRQSHLLIQYIDYFKQAYRKVWQNYPFESVAVCVLPDHVHAIWTLPPDDCNYSLRWQLIKRYFSRHFNVSQTRSHSKIKYREKGIWQRRFWEHEIRDEQDLQRCIDYVHFNPVKHGYVARCIDWEYSTFHHYVRLGMLPENWGGTELVRDKMHVANWG